jgi:hypothetical protein
MLIQVRVYHALGRLGKISCSLRKIRQTNASWVGEETSIDKVDVMQSGKFFSALAAATERTITNCCQTFWARAQFFGTVKIIARQQLDCSEMLFL